ncbi:MAG: hypothetical protein RJA55_2313 [Acidobacteriota bacterium]|jgi:hypothetical protein
MAFDAGLLSKANSYGYQLPKWVVDSVNDPNNPNAQSLQERYSGQMQEMVDAQANRMAALPGQQIFTNGGGLAMTKELHPEAQFFDPTTMQQPSAGPTKGFGQLPTQPQGGQPQNPYMPQPFSVGGGGASSSPPAQSGGGWPGASGGTGGPVGFDNPYLAAQANAMTDQVSRRFNQQIAPSIRRNAVATGGFGGSRQGIAEGMAAQGAQDALTGGLANLYSSGYQADRGYDLGMGGLYNQGRSLDMQQARLGGDLFTQGLNNSIGVGNALYESGQREQMAPWQNSINPYLNAISLLAGNSGTTSTGGQTGGGLGGALGGGIAGAQLYKLLFGG